MVFSTIVRQAGVKRIPLIRFRKGGNVMDASHSHGVAATTTNVQHSARAVSGAAAIEDWQLPPRYWRRPIDEKECEYINRGGPE